MIKTYIIHVSTDIERERHIKHELEQKGLLQNAKFINDGDLKDLNADLLSKYFKGKMLNLVPITSCSYKHFLAMEEVSKDNKCALIVEDDICFEKNFNQMLDATLKEIEQKKLSNFIINIEDSIPHYVPGGLRRKGEYIYPLSPKYLKPYGRGAGAYIIDHLAARNMIIEGTTNKSDVFSDWFPYFCHNKKLITVYWLHPTVAMQGSLNGDVLSTIQVGIGYGLFRKLSFFFQRYYKRFLYWLR